MAHPGNDPDGPLILFGVQFHSWLKRRVLSRFRDAHEFSSSYFFAAE